MMLSQKMNISFIFLPAYAKKILKNILEYPVCKNYFKVSPSLPLIQDDDEEEYAFLRYAKQSWFAISGFLIEVVILPVITRFKILESEFRAGLTLFISKDYVPKMKIQRNKRFCLNICT